MKKAFISTLINLMALDDNIYLFTGDLGYGVMNPIIEKYPNKFFNVGICEQNMAAAAAGMALEKNTVFMYSIGNFPTLRCLEQIRNDIAYHNANVKVVAAGGGFSYGQLGMSHHATEDIAIMRSIPGMSIFVPADPWETHEAVRLATRIDGPVYIRLGRGGEPEIPHIDRELSSPMKIKEELSRNGEKSIAIIGIGQILVDTCRAVENLKLDMAVRVYSVPQIKPIDVNKIAAICKENNYIITVEEHTIKGGLGSIVAEIIAESNINVSFKRIGLNDQFTDVVGTPQFLRERYRMDKEGILSTIKEMVKNEKNCDYCSE